MAHKFQTPRDAALALIQSATLSEREGQFCGGLVFRTAPLSEKQANWLGILLKRHNLPALAGEGDNAEIS